MAIAYRITIAEAGTPVQGPDAAGFDFVLQGAPANAGTVYVYDSDTDTAANGYALGPGQQVPIRVSNLNTLWFDASANGQAVLALRVW
jgi:hypothetical protein